MAERKMIYLDDAVKTIESFNRVDSDILKKMTFELKDLPSANQWIPCSERLPEIGEQCLLTVHYVELGGIECNRVIIGVYSDNYKNHILAWMPLPKAYEGENRMTKDEALKQNQWIPRSERLPNVRQWVLCQCKLGIMDVLRLTADGSWNKNYPYTVYMHDFVVAWMPLPESYRVEINQRNGTG